MPTWITDNRHLSLEEMQNNVQIIVPFLLERGWTKNAIAGLCGNMQSESSISPGRHEVGGTGFGLVQWTPPTNFTDWASKNGYANDDGYAQLIWIDEVTVPFGQWGETDEYPISFATFKTSEESPEYLASAFLRNFERPGDIPGTEPGRREQARYWFDYIGGIEPKKKKKRALWPYMILYRRSL